jgi:hypothetical protein
LTEADRILTSNSLEAIAAPGLDRLGLRLELAEIVQAADRKRQAQRMRFGILLLLASLILATYVVSERSTEITKAERIQAQWNGALTKERKIRDEALAELTVAQKLQAAVDRAFRPAQSLDDVVTVAVNSAPTGVWLNGITLERGKQLVLRGTATNSLAVSAYMQRLSAESRLRDVKLVGANNSEIEKTPVIQFSISAFPVGNLPLVDQKKKGAKK